MVLAPHSSTPATLSPNDRELIQVLLDDVGLMESRLRIGPPSPQEIRATFSPILRKWIVEPPFYKSQKLIKPHVVRFPIVGNAQAVKYCQAGVFEHWMGYMLIGAIGISAGQVARKYLGKGNRPEYTLPPISAPTSQHAKQLFEQKMFYWKEKFYTRADVVKWLVNRFGGAHLDFRRKDDEAHINEIKNYFGIELDGSNHQMLVGKDIALGRADPRRRPRIYDATELVAMDTARIFSEGIRRSESAFTSLLR